MMPKCLLLRADANSSMGTGHVMRCIALAQAWSSQGGVALFASRDLPEPLRSRLAAESFRIYPLDTQNDDIEQTIKAGRESDASWIVLDGYHFGIAHQRSLRDAGFRVLTIDDYGHAGRYFANLVLNQNLGADEKLYENKALTTKLLLGTRYVLLRREFHPFAEIRRSTDSNTNRILVIMGGADAGNISAEILRTLSTISWNDLHVRVVVGPANPNRICLQEAAATVPFAVELISAPDIPALMLWADMAISATGTTCWELMFMQVPFVGLAVVDNQDAIAKQLASHGVATTFSWPAPREALAVAIRDLVLSQEKHLAQVSLGRRLVDGLGATRVINLLQH